MSPVSQDAINPVMENPEVRCWSCADIENQLAKPLRRLFFDVYFASMYNSSLLFHRPTFSTDVEMGRVPVQVLLAIYASATMYGIPYIVASPKG
jgi:hypothetical protein